jgi:hypothetical protein
LLAKYTGRLAMKIIKAMVLSNTHARRKRVSQRPCKSVLLLLFGSVFTADRAGVVGRFIVVLLATFSGDQSGRYSIIYHKFTV